jgi:DNA polymerase
MSIVYWDVETFSCCKLKDCGAHVYAADPSTGVFFVCYAVDDGEVQTWRPSDPVPVVFAAPTSHTFVSDNWTFERLILKHVLIPQHGFVPLALEQQDCAQRKALASAFPAELGLRCEALELPYRKNLAARRAMLRLARMHEYKDPAARERDLELLWQRCLSDVAMTRAAYNHPRLRPLPPEERLQLLFDAEINERGIRANVPFLTAALALATAEHDAVNARLAEITAGAVTSVDQVKKLKDAVNAQGHKLKTLGKRAVAAALAHQPEELARELLELRQRGAHASGRMAKRLLAHAALDDHRIRGALRFDGSATGRWSSPGAQLHNISRNDAEHPATLVDAVLTGDRAALARFGDPIKVATQLSRAALCAGPENELICADLSAIESRIPAWFANEVWKLAAFRKYDATGDETLHPYRQIVAQMLHKGVLAIVKAERQMGKCAELACGFGGALGAWRKIAGDEDTRSDAEVLVMVRNWRAAHPRIVDFWYRLMRAARLSIETGETIRVMPAPRPSIVTAFDGTDLTIELPSGRVINYPGARLAVNEKFASAGPDIEFMDNALKRWKPVRAWHGTIVENVVQGTARDLLAAAITRVEARWPGALIFHCHDEIVLEAPIGTISAQDVLACLLEAPPWAAGLPLGGKVHVGPLYLEAPETAAPPSAAINPPSETVEVAINPPLDDADQDALQDDIALTCLDEMHAAESAAPASSTDAAVESLPWEGAAQFGGPAAEINGFAAFTDAVVGYERGKILCPFHAEKTPSCQLYDDGHYHCFGCKAHGWIAEDIGELPAEVLARAASAEDDTGTLARAHELWVEAKPIAGTLAERYLAETRKLDLTLLPNNIDDVLRFHPRCPFGVNGTRHPCLVAMFRDVESDQFAGIHRIGLTADAKKIKRLTLGRWAGVRAIKLWSIVTHKLSIGEGIETVLGAVRCSAITTPAWAIGPKADIATFPVLPGVKAISVLVDRGDPAALDGAMECIKRHVAAGCGARWLRTVHVKDFNDLVMP